MRTLVLFLHIDDNEDLKVKAGNTKGESVTVQLTSCLTGLESAI